MKIINKLRVYKDAGTTMSPSMPPQQQLIVEDSSFSNDFVVLRFGDVELSVKASELRAAIVNATNKGRYG